MALLSPTLLSHWAKKTALMVSTCLVERTAPCSAFKGKGKARALRQLEKNPRFHIAYRQLGVEWNIQPETLEQLEHATYLMHLQSQESSVDVVRIEISSQYVWRGSEADKGIRVIWLDFLTVSLLRNRTSSVGTTARPCTEPTKQYWRHRIRKTMISDG